MALFIGCDLIYFILIFAGFEKMSQNTIENCIFSVLSYLILFRRAFFSRLTSIIRVCMVIYIVLEHIFQLEIYLQFETISFEAILISCDAEILQYVQQFMI